MPRRVASPLVAAAAVAALGLLYVVAFRTQVGRDADDAALSGVLYVLPEFLEDLMELIVATAGPFPFALATVALVFFAKRDHGMGTAVRVLAILIGANVTSQVLKVLTAQPRIHEASISAEAWPSGHSTSAATLIACSLIVFGDRAPWKWLLAWGALIWFGVCSLGWHYQSDAAAGVLVTIAWTAAVLSGSAPDPTAALRRRSPPATG